MEVNLKTLYRHHMKKPRTLQQRHLRFILKIKWFHLVANDEFLQLAKTGDIEIALIKNRFYLLGEVARMLDERPVKNLLYGEFSEGTRRVGYLFLWFKDTMKDILKRGAILGM